MPTPSRSATRSGARGRAIAELVAAGAAFAASRGDLRERVTEAAWSQDLAATRRDLAAHGDHWLRWLKRSYRRARAAWRGIATAQAPADLKAQLAVLDRLIAAQADARADRRRGCARAGGVRPRLGRRALRLGQARRGAGMAARAARPGAAAPPGAPARRGRRPRAADPAGRAQRAPAQGGRRRLGAAGRAAAARSRARPSASRAARA